MPTNQGRKTRSNTSITASQLMYQGAKRRSQTVNALLEGQDVSSDSDIEVETNTEDSPVAGNDTSSNAANTNARTSNSISSTSESTNNATSNHASPNASSVNNDLFNNMSPNNDSPNITPHISPNIERNNHHDGPINIRPSVRPRLIIEPLETSNINHQKYLRFSQCTLTDLAMEASLATRKGYLDLQIIRMIANGRSGQQNQVRFYKAKDNSKKVSTVGYKRLFLLRIIRTDEPTPHMVYILEDDINHANIWNHFTSIRDNGGITIGTVLRLFGPKPYENIMPDGVPSIVTRFPVAIMKQPTAMLEVKINYEIQGGESMAFCLNACELTSLSISAEESGCAGLFCDKQRVLEVRRYNDGCCCYSFDSRRTNMIVDHAMNIAHYSLREGKIYASNYSSVQFSLLYQTAVFSSQVRQTSLDLTDLYFELEDAATGAMDLINRNGGFTVTGWYKRGEVTDRTILHQTNNSDSYSKSSLSSDKKDNQVDNSKITFHPCVIKPTNPDFSVNNTALYQALQALKFDVSKLLHLA
jgi:hypothetical protein